MGIYLFLVFATLFMFVFKDKINLKSNKIIYVFLCVFIITLVGFRSVSVGSDSLEYRRIFLDTSKSTFGEILIDNSRFEKGFLLYMKLLSCVTTDYHFFFIISAILSIAPIFVFIYKYSRNCYFSLAMFVLLRFMFMEMNIMRQMIAIGFLFIALNCMITKRRKLSLFMILVATTFHITAIIFILLLLASMIRFEINKYKVRIWIIASAVMYLIADFLLTALFSAFPQFSHYETSDYFQKNNIANFVSVILCLAFILILFLYNAFPRRYQFRITPRGGIVIKNEYALTRILVISMLFSLMMFFMACKASLIDRIATYFYICSIVYVPNIIEKYAKKEKFLAYSLMLVVFISYFVITLVFRPEWNYVVPYVFWG